MRYSLIFNADRGAEWNPLTNERFPDEVIPINPLTRLELLNVGPAMWRLRFDAIPLGDLVVIVRDRMDEQAPTIPWSAPRPAERDLRARAQAVVNLSIPDNPDDDSFFHHSRDWCLGYQQACRDLLRDVRPPPEPTEAAVPSCPEGGPEHGPPATQVRSGRVDMADVYPQLNLTRGFVTGVSDVGWRCRECGHEWGFEVLTDEYIAAVKQP